MTVSKSLFFVINGEQIEGWYHQMKKMYEDDEVRLFIYLHNAETVNGKRVTLIFGAYHLPAMDAPKMTALNIWSIKSKIKLIHNIQIICMILTGSTIWISVGWWSMWLVCSQTYFKFTNQRLMLKYLPHSSSRYFFFSSDNGS